MKFTIALVCLITCVTLLVIAAIAGKKLSAGIAGIGALISGFAVNRFAGENEDEPS